MHRKELLWATAAAMALVCGGLSQPASAQQSGGAAELDEVVVTARRVEENIQQVPVAVTAVSGEKLDQLVVNSVQDLNKISAALANGNCSGTRESCTPVIRGQNTAFSSNRPSVVAYFAEVPNFQASFFDLQSVQVVAGPQGTLYGETATGGVILYTPRRPSNEFGGYVSAQGGNYNYHSFEGAVGGAIIPDKLMVRASGEYRKRKGFTKAISTFGAPPTDFDNENSKQIRLQVIFKPFENVENFTLYAYSDNKIHGNSSPILLADRRFMNPSIRDVVPASFPNFVAQWLMATGTTPAPGRTFGQLIEDAAARQIAAGPRTTFYNYDRHRREKFNGVINTTRWDVTENLTVKNIFGLSWTKGKGPTIDVDGTDQAIVDTRAIWVPGTTSSATGEYAYTGGWPARQWTNEVQVLGSLFDDRLDWQAGYYYRYDASREWIGGQGVIAVFSGPQGDPAPAAFCTSINLPSPCTQIQQRKDISYAGFAQATFALTPKLNLTAGYRRTWDQRATIAAGAATYRVNVNGTLIAVPVSEKVPLPGSRTSITLVPKAHADTYTLTADYQVNDDVLVYVTHRTGYKGGGINSNALPGSAERTFGPEKLTDTEIGAKADFELAGIRGRLNIALYKDKYTDVQRSQVISGTATTFTSNLADVKMQGVEFDATLYLTNWFRLGGNFAYLDGKYTEYLENRVCQTQYWRPQCAGLPATTPVVVDHAKGFLTINGQTINFKPDELNDAHPVKWSLQPTILLKDLTGEDISIGANIQYLSRWTGNPSNTNEYAGVPEITVNSILGPISEPYFRPKKTMIDLRADWRNVKGSRVSVGASVTNVTNELVNLSGAGGFTIGGTAPAILAEPRMWYLEVKYEFGG